MRILLDANVWGDISAGGNESELVAVQAAVTAGRFKVFASSPLVEELSAAHLDNPQLALHLARQLFGLSQLWLKDAERRIIEEVAHGEKLDGDGAFLQFRDPSVIEQLIGPRPRAG